MWLLRLWGHFCSHPERRGHLGPEVRYQLKSLRLFFCLPGSSRKGRSVKNGSCPSPPVGRCISTRRPPPLPRSGRATASPAPTPPTLTSAPTQVLTAPSHQSHIDQSSSDPQTRCSATLGSGSQHPTTLSPFRGTSFTTTASSF